MRVHVLQHEAFEGLGSLEPWFLSHGHALSTTALHRGAPLPPRASFDWLVVLGGSMGVNDEARFSWLADEKALVRSAIDAGSRVLGICLGAQLVAASLGARVTRNPCREIGWFDVERTPNAARNPLGALLPARASVFHWHGDTFDVPPGAEWLARSEACAHQAFACERRVLGLQFHLETTRAGASLLAEHCGGDLDGSAFVQSPGVFLRDEARFAAPNELMARLLSAME